MGNCCAQANPKPKKPILEEEKRSLTPEPLISREKPPKVKKDKKDKKDKKKDKKKEKKSKRSKTNSSFNSVPETKRESKSVPPLFSVEESQKVDVAVSMESQLGIIDRKKIKVNQVELEMSDEVKKGPEMSTQDIKRFLNCIQNQDQMDEIKAICRKYEINDITEFTYQRVSHAARDLQLSQEESQSCTRQLSLSGSYQLFGREAYSYCQMNPFQLALVFKNVAALTFFINKYNHHFRLNLMAPPISQGALQIKDSNLMQQECWPLFVAINNKDLQMLMYLWQDIGSSPHKELEQTIGPSESVGIDKDNSFVSKSVPHRNSFSFSGNGNVTKLWGQSHLIQIVEAMCKENYSDGLKFILSCKATFKVYQTMSAEAKLNFLVKFLVQRQNRLDVEIKEILKLKLTQPPFATLAIFTMIQVDKQSLIQFQINRQKQKSLKKGSDSKNSFDMGLSKEHNLSNKSSKSFAPLQGGNFVHIDTAFNNINAQELLRFQNDYQYYDEYVTQNLNNLKKISNNLNHGVYLLACKIESAIKQMTTVKGPNSNFLKNEKQKSYQMASNVQTSFDQSIINDWVGYNDVVRKQLFIYAKRGDIKKFKDCVNLYNIKTFARLKIPVAQRPNGVGIKNMTRKRIQRKIMQESSSEKGSSEVEEDEDSGEEEVKEQDKKNLLLAQARRSSQSSIAFSELNQSQEIDQGIQQLKEIQLPRLGEEITILQSPDEIAELTPLHIAIMHRNLDIVKYIIGHMDADIGLGMTVIVGYEDNDDAMERLFPQQSMYKEGDGNSNIKEQTQYQEFSEECQSYGLLIACSNKDIKMFKYIWTQMAPFIYDVSNFTCVMRQLISQEWLEGIDFILQNQTTKQMILSLQSEERSYFIENFIGNPLEKSFCPLLQRCLIINLCKPPYAGAFLIYLLDNFEDLTSSKKLDKQKKDGKNSKGLDSLNFENMWVECLEGVYPMEIQVLKDTNEEKFKDFITDWIHNQNNGRRRDLALKLISLLQSIPNFTQFLQETSAQQIEAGIEEKYHKEQFKSKIINQARIIEQAWKESPEYLKHFIIATIGGDISQLRSIVDQNGLSAQDIVEMRGIECKAFCEVRVQGGPTQAKNRRSIILDTNNWNPLHFATFYQQKKVLQFFKQFFGEQFDIRYAMQFTENDLISFEGAIQRKKNQNIAQQQKVIKQLLQKNYHLYGFLIAIFTYNVEIFQFLCSADGPGTPQLGQILVLIQICQDLQWREGLISLISSKLTKRLFVMCSFADKTDFVANVLSKEHFQDQDQKNPEQKNQQEETFFKEIDQIMQQFPYVISSWRVKDTMATEEDNDEVDFNRYFNQFQNNFDELCVNAINQVNQLQEIVSICKQKPIVVEALFSEIKSKRDTKSAQISTEQQRVQKIQNHIIKMINQTKTKNVNCSQLCHEIAVDVLACNDPQKNFAAEFKMKTLQKMSEMSQNGTIKFIKEIKGYEDKAFEIQNQKQFKGIHIKKMNILHWIFYTNRNDILKLLMQKHFSKPTSQLEEIQESDSYNLTRQNSMLPVIVNLNQSMVAFQQCMIGESGSFYDFEYFKNHKIKKDQEHFIFYIKNSENVIGMSKQVKNSKNSQLKIKIKNLGLVIIILSKNQGALELILKQFKQIFFDLNNDILGAVFLCCIKQWNQGLKLLLGHFKVVFAKLPLIEKFEFVQKIFTVLKNYKSQIGTAQCVQMLLSDTKVLNYIDWQEKNPQMMIVLKIYVRQLFNTEAQIHIKQSQDYQNQNLVGGNNPNNNHATDLDQIQKKMTKSEMVDDDNQTKLKNNKFIEESHELEYHERQNFFNGVYSSNFQKILMLQQDKNPENSTNRDQEVLKFIISRIISNKL